MSEPLAAEELAEIRARADAATPGPWAVDIEPAYHTASPSGDSEPAFMRGVRAADGRHVVRFDDDYGTDQWDDARLIAHARTDVPLLLDEIARLKMAYGRLADLAATVIEASGRKKAVVAALRQMLEPVEIRSREADETASPPC